MVEDSKSISLFKKSVIKKMLLFFIPSYLSFLLLTIYIFKVQIASDIYTKQDHEVHDINVTKNYVSNQFENVIEDLGYISGIIQDHYKNPGKKPSLNGINIRIKLFADTHKKYDQIRFINDKGWEVIRINNLNGNSKIVREKDLQFKGQRYYFKECIKLAKGSVYFSPFDLNIENNRIEIPYKPMIRIANPVYNTSTEKIGVSIINYLGADLLENFRNTGSKKKAGLMLLNSDGYFLKGEKKEDEWGFMFRDKKDIKFGKKYPEAWKNISSKKRGQFETDEGLFTFTTVYPIPEISSLLRAGGKISVNRENYYWKIVSFFPRAKYLATTKPWLYGSVSICILAFFIFGIVFWKLAWFSEVKKNDEILLKRSRDNLESRVQERMIELEESNKKLLSVIKSRKKIESDLMDSENQFKMLVETMPEGLIVIDKKGYITYANDQILKMLIYEREDFVNKHYSSFLNEANIEKYKKQREKRKSDGGSPYELSWITGNGDSLETLVSPSVIRDREGNFNGSFGIISDITKRKKYEKGIKINRDRLKALVELSRMDNKSEKELAGFALEQSVKLTESEGGYFHFYGEEEGDILLTSWSEDVLKICKSAEGTHYPLEEAGIWADSLRKRRPVVHNDYQNEKEKKGYPEGHFPVKRHMSIPVFDSKKIIAIAGLGNKEKEYDESDVEQLTILMTEVWRIITKNKVKEKLLESEKKYRTLFETMEQGVLYQDSAGKVISANKSALKLLNTTKEEIETYFEKIWENARNENGDPLKSNEIPSLLSLKKGKIVRNFVLSLPSAVNKDIWLQIDAIPQFISSLEKPDSVYTIFKDITESRNYQSAVEASEEKHRSMMEAMDDPVYICGTDYKISYINLAMKRWIGKNCVGDLCYKSIYDRDENCPWCSFQEIINGKSVKYTILNPKDNRHYNVSNSPINNADGTISKFTIFRDITETLNLEKQLRHVQKLEAIGTLAGGIAHDFNNILSAIIGFSEISLMSLKEGDRIYNDIREIMKAGYRARDLVQQILTFSRQTEQEMKPVRISYIIKEVLNLLKASLPSTIKIDEDITSKSYILGDVTQIHQVIMNICTNGAHAMEDGGGTLNVELFDRYYDKDFTSGFINMPPGDYVCLRITDDGEGIQKDDLERIFEPFYTSKPEGKGTGLGLSLVHGIVKNHKGQITVKSKVGEGSVFMVFLPVLNFETDFAAPYSKKNLPSGNEKIMMVDDEEKIVEIAKRHLNSLGYLVETYTNPKKALEMFKSNPNEYDLVITDMTMPEMTGDVFLKELSDIKEIPVIVCTGFSEKLNHMKSGKAEPAKILMKPVMKDELVKTVREVLDEHFKDSGINSKKSV